MISFNFIVPSIDSWCVYCERSKTTRVHDFNKMHRRDFKTSRFIAARDLEKQFSHSSELNKAFFKRFRFNYKRWTNLHIDKIGKFLTLQSQYSNLELILSFIDIINPNTRLEW